MKKNEKNGFGKEVPNIFSEEVSLKIYQKAVHLVLSEAKKHGEREKNKPKGLLNPYISFHEELHENSLFRLYMTRKNRLSSDESWKF